MRKRDPFRAGFFVGICAAFLGVSLGFGLSCKKGPVYEPQPPAPALRSLAVEPTRWPLPSEFPAGAAPIADYLNEPIKAARLALQARQRAAGWPVASSEQDFERYYLPLYPRDGWWQRTGIPRFQVIGPAGISGFGLHEFMGYPEITQRLNRMQLLWKNSLTNPVPLPTRSPGPGPTPIPPVLPTLEQRVRALELQVFGR